MGNGKVSFQKKIVVGLLLLWAILLIIFGLVHSGLLSRKVSVFFFQNQSDGSLKLVEIPRQIKIKGLKTDTSEMIKYALKELILGPTQEESEAYISCVPAEANIRDVKIENDLIYVDFDENIESGGGVLELQGRLAQIVFTATQFSPQSGVRLLIEGKEIKSFGGEGITDVEKPMFRSDFEKFLQGEKNER